LENDLNSPLYSQILRKPIVPLAVPQGQDAFEVYGIEILAYESEWPIILVLRPGSQLSLIDVSTRDVIVGIDGFRYGDLMYLRQKFADMADWGVRHPQIVLLRSRAKELVEPNAVFLR
jgi:hypothetical protein